MDTLASSQSLHILANMSPRVLSQQATWDTSLGGPRVGTCGLAS